MGYSGTIRVNVQLGTVEIVRVNFQMVFTWKGVNDRLSNEYVVVATFS